ncbi:Transcription factor like [Actinidia chinensis var. chinensis]|uniref:Transcription factor like n=1 Tax=Actinidia chinensis var. chinensis TaxID=1590841 RepID=A0A2R6PRS5_ACTCC|nr:Transcription factor like [Actinidia chinensis var. chinensis]
MASGTLGGEETRERNRWGENNKVYTRKKGLKTTTTSNANANAANNDTTVAATFTATTVNNENNNNDNNVVPQQSLQALATEDLNSSQKQLDVESDDSSNHDRPPQVDAPNGCEPPQVDVPNGFELPNENGDIRPIIVKVDNRVRINLAEGRSKNEIRELKRKLVSELDEVRSLAKRLEAKGIQLTSYSIAAAAAGGYSHSQYSANDGRALMRVNSEVGSVSHHDSRLFRQLSVSVVENNYGVGDLVEKEKRTPKANQYYRNSEFLLGKDRLPPAESNKKLKSNGGKKHGREMGYGFGLSKSISKIFKRCNNLLSRLMKHKHAWVFNKPVDAKALGLHDYHDIIKNPMDLGTVKSRLAKNWYKSPREFAEDVRLTFRNAMTYNPKGQDVHVMAEELLMIFEEKWAVIESEYCFDWRFELVHDVGLPTPTSRKVQPPHPALPPSAFEMRTLERAESMIMAADSRLKLNAPVGRTPVPKKPKAKDPNKRDMTYEEKQRLSTHLQSLPPEKLDSIVQIIKKRNTALSQHDDEIEVDIDSVDAETLWELDRFVTNYKKILSKNKRKAELALQARAETTTAVPATNPGSAVVEAPKESKADENNVATSPAQGERQGDNVSGSSNSSSSSSDSDSTSSDSDSDSSSANGSDAGHSPGT